MGSVAVAPQFSVGGVAAHLLRLEDSVPVFNLAPGTRLFGAGDPCERVFALMEGRVKLAVEGAGRKSCLLHILEPGDVIDESTLLGERFHRTTATMVESGSVVIATLASVRRELENGADLWRLLGPLFRRRLGNLQDQLQWVCLLEVEQRVARILLRWAEAEGRSLDEGSPLRLSQKDLSDMVGATRESTSTALNRLRREGCIELGRRSIVVRSAEKLREVALDPERPPLKPVAV